MTPSCWSSTVRPARPSGSGAARAGIRHRRWIQAALLLFGLVAARPLAAQDDGRDATDIWLGLALGAAGDTRGELSGAGLAALQLSVLTSRWAFGLRASLALDLDDGAADFGAFFGRNWRNRWGHAMLASGLAATTFDEDRATVGIPLIAEVGLDLLPVLGGGLQAFANMNPVTPYFGVSLFVSMGEVR